MMFRGQAPAKRSGAEQRCPSRPCASVLCMSALLSACHDHDDNAAAPTWGPQTYAVGGAVTRLNGSPVLQNNGGDDLTLNADGTLRFATALASGAAYLVTVRSMPGQQTCAVTHASGTLGT